MNIFLKSAIAGALALSATGAFALGVPSTGSSDLVLVVENETTQAVYALDTGISISSVLPTSSLDPTSNNGTTLSTAVSIAGQTVAGSSTLQSFLSAAGDTYGWTIEAAQFPTSSTNAVEKVPGNAIAIFSSAYGTSNNALVVGAGLSTLEGFTAGLNTDVTAGGLQPLQTAAETTAASYSANAASKYGWFGAPDLSAVGGTAQQLFGFTGGGTTTSYLQSYLLGTATLSSTGTLTFAGNSSGAPVPLPAAVWLFGSGLMGLVGVSRRRKAAV